MKKVKHLRHIYSFRFWIPRNIGPSLAHGLTSQKGLARAQFGPSLLWPTMGWAKTEPNHSKGPSRLELGRPAARPTPILYEFLSWKCMVLLFIAKLCIMKQKFLSDYWFLFIISLTYISEQKRQNFFFIDMIIIYSPRRNVCLKKTGHNSLNIGYISKIFYVMLGINLS